MLTILFSPSEAKRPGGEAAPGSMLFGAEGRRDILEQYNRIVLGSDDTLLAKLFGLKDPDTFARYRHDIFSAPRMPALERYDGVAFDYLGYAALDADAQAYIDAHCIIFSNLFGPIKGADAIPDYKVKQGESIGGIAPERYYAERYTAALDALLEDHDILDLRAGYYDKFYKPSKPFTTLKFVKEGKVVSHWAKAYRGIVLREAARHKVESLDAFMALEIDGLVVDTIKKGKNKTEIVYDIVG